MNSTYLNLVANAGRAAITHVGLVDDVGTEIASGSYARQAVTWTAAADGDFVLDDDLVFDLAEGDTVAGWRGYSASSGGSDYGGAALTETTFGNDGTFTLLAASTGISHDAA